MSGEVKKKKNPHRNHIGSMMAFWIAILALVLVLGTLWTGSSASKATLDAVKSVSGLYLDELAGRREQVVASNLESSIRNLQVAIGLLDEEDLKSMENLQTFQRRMKQLYDVEKFAFVDSQGLIYTSGGIQTDIDAYPFNYKELSEPVVEVKDLSSTEKKVIVAVPAGDVAFQDETFRVAFMEIDMERMLLGVSMQSDRNRTTFCNLYTKDGVALTNVVLGGLASEDNLLEAMNHAVYEPGYSYAKMLDSFANNREGLVSFTYNGIAETLYFVPVEGTDWMLTYLIRESVISEQISSISDGIFFRSIVQTVLTAVAMLLLFYIVMRQIRRSSEVEIENERREAETRIKQQELEEKLKLQEQLYQNEMLQIEQNKMITALSSDSRSVYYVDLDAGEGVCYRVDHTKKSLYKEGEHFNYMEAIRHYANYYVDERYRDAFLHFIEPDFIRKSLEKEDVMSLRYLTVEEGEAFYEMLKIAAVRKQEDRDDNIIHAVGLGFFNVDRETRETMQRAQALSDALAVAEEANKAKTAFLSNMSHEIRTPMNAIIGLDTIALADPDISPKTRESLEKIGDSARHLLGLINDILDMSRIESGRMVINNEEFSFSALLQQINTLISGQCQEKGLEFECSIIGQLSDMYIGDDMKLKQVIINILSNAIKFTPEGGKVRLSIEKTGQFEGKTALKFQVSDTGIGISKEYLPKIFEAFSQEKTSASNKYGSTGLGLAITKNIVEMMNGRIEVESEQNVGTTFTIYVTLVDAENSHSMASRLEIDPSQLDVLVVDDDAVALEHAKVVLESVGIGTETATSGEEALEMVRLRKARQAPYNLILVDWKMPGMDGVETTRQIRRMIGLDSAIIILTAYKWDEILEEALTAGVDRFVAKPLFASNVLDEINQAVQSKETRTKGQTEKKADLNGRRILLAEDMMINAEIMKEVLKMRGMQVDHAENGKICVEKYAAHPEGYYDAVLMDMRMPEMDGLEATKTIRAMDREDAKTIPIIALTANAFNEDVERSLQAGLNAHLSKPVEPDKLFKTLEKLCQ
ncbi:MAG: response regulator [Firmicutes bacterium]|nr:response regulator [Bacillota bacterium]